MRQFKHSNYFTHLKIITKHKLLVTKYCFKSGLYWQGITHDLSKFSPIEFFESVKFFTGTSSPIDEAKRQQGYSLAWLNHKGRNKHHYEYWIDNLDDGGTALRMPEKYVLEMVCDWIAAGQVYEKSKWTQESPIKYFRNVKSGIKMHEESKKLLVVFLENIAEKGLNEFFKEVKSIQW